MSELGDEIKALIAERRADHGRALHGAGAHPSRTRLLHEPRPLRRGGRFHDRAGNLADVRRTDRPVGGRGVDHDGPPRSAAPRRTRPGPRHADERRLARGAHRAGVSRRARRDAGRDEPDARRNPARNAADLPARRSPGRRASPRRRRGRRSSSPTNSSTRCRCANTCAAAAAGASAMVALDKSGGLVFAPRPPAGALHSRRAARRATSLETSPTGHRFMSTNSPAGWCNRAASALFIDYGHDVTAIGETLQAVRGHRMVDPLVEPGECDLTAHVDFAAMARSARAAGAAVYGPSTRAISCARSASTRAPRRCAERAPERAEEFEQARRRLVGKERRRDGRPVQGDGRSPAADPPPPGFQPDFEGPR